MWSRRLPVGPVLFAVVLTDRVHPVELAGVWKRFRIGRVIVLIEVKMYEPSPQHLDPDLIAQLRRKLQERRDFRIPLDTCPLVSIIIIHSKPATGQTHMALVAALGVVKATLFLFGGSISPAKHRRLVMVADGIELAVEDACLHIEGVRNAVWRQRRNIIDALGPLRPLVACLRLASF